jgi:hypothetical protein
LVGFVDSFSVICETCKSRLKVRDASLIGQIHACPKCDSMVQIQPPAASQRMPTAAPIVVAEIADITVPPQPTGTLSMEFVELPAPATLIATTLSPFVWWCSGGIAFILLAGLAAAMWLRGEGNADVSVEAPVVAESSHNAEPSVAPNPYAVDTPAEPTVAADPPTPNDADRQIATQPADPPPTAAALPELPADEQRTTSERVEPAKRAAAALPPEPDVRLGSPKTAAPGDEKPDAPVLTFDPLDFDPARLSLGSASPPSPPPSAASMANSIDNESSADSEIEMAPASEERAEALLPNPARDQTLHVRLGPMPSDRPRDNNAAEQLALQVDSLRLSDVPLARFVDVLSRMAGVPIALDGQSLELAGVSPRQPISVSVENIAIEKILQDALSKRRLTLLAHEGTMRITLRNAQQRRTIDYQLSDLCPGGDAAPLAELIERFVAPTSWQPAGGKGTIAMDGTTLHIEQAQSAHHEILIFCERLRLARGLALRSRYPAARLSIVPPQTALAGKLHARTTFTFLPWTPLGDIFRHWEETSGFTILVDWAALANQELAPWSPAACSVVHRTWNEALDHVLAPLELAWWAVDPETLQITTREALDHIQRIEFHFVPQSLQEQFASKDALIEALQNEAPQADDSGGTHSVSLHMEFDEPSGRLLVRGSPLAQQYLIGRLTTDSKQRVEAAPPGK